MKDQKLAQFLRSHREAAELTQGQVAKKLGYGSSQFISNWERGMSAPPMRSLRTLAKLYKINMDELFEQVSEASLEHMGQVLRKQYLGMKRRAK